MRTIGAFNIIYGSLGVAASVYLVRPEGLAVSFWVMGSGFLLRLRLVDHVWRVVGNLIRGSQKR